jgi:hypothetical protein
MAREAKTILTTEDKTGPGIKSAVSNLLGLDDATKKLGKTIATAFTVGAIAGAVKQIADFGVGSYKAFAEAEKAAVSFNTALAARTDVSRRSIESFNASFSRSFGVDGEAILGMQTMLLASGRTEGQIKKIMEAAQGLSVATGKDLKTAVDELNKSFSGTEGRMGTLIPELKDLTDAQLKAGEGVDIVLGKFGHLNATVADLADTKLKNLNNAWGDMQEAIGGNVTSWLSPALVGLEQLLSAWSNLITESTRYHDIQKTEAARRTAEEKRFVVGKKMESLQTKIDGASYDASGMLPVDQWKKDLGVLAGEYRNLTTEINAQAGAYKRLTTEPASGGSAGSGGATPVEIINGVADGPVWNDPNELGRVLAINLVDVIRPLMSDPNEAYAPVEFPRKPGGSESLGDIGLPNMDMGPIIGALEPIIKVVDSLFGTLGPMITSLSSVKAILDPIGTILGAMFEVLGPLINDALAPLVGILKLIGRGLGSILAPAVEFLGSVIETVVKGILWVWNGIVKAINWALGWTGVHLEKVTFEDTGDAGTTMTGTTGSGASYSGSQAITFNFYNQGNVVGSGGLQELAATIYALIQQNARYA